MRIVAALFVVILHYNNSNIGAALVYAEGTGITENMLLVFRIPVHRGRGYFYNNYRIFSMYFGKKIVIKSWRFIISGKCDECY